MFRIIKNISIGIILTLLVITTINGIFDIVYGSFSQYEKGREIAQKMGCEYLGSSRSVSEVRFLNCDGKVVTILVR